MGVEGLCWSPCLSLASNSTLRNCETSRWFRPLAPVLGRVPCDPLYHLYPLFFDKRIVFSTGGGCLHFGCYPHPWPTVLVCPHDILPSPNPTPAKRLVLPAWSMFIIIEFKTENWLCQFAAQRHLFGDSQQSRRLEPPLDFPCAHVMFVFYFWNDKSFAFSRIRVAGLELMTSSGTSSSVTHTTSTSSSVTYTTSTQTFTTATTTSQTQRLA